MNYYSKVNHSTSDEDCRMICEAELVKQMLQYCMMQHGAKITISVEHDDGHKATARLYDHAALVQSLHDSLEYFQSEML